MPNVKIDNDTVIHYIESGTGSQNILFIHGNLASGLWWEDIMSKLPSKFHAYALDLPGSGDSPETGKRHTIDYFADVIFKFISKLSLKDLIIVGHSMGGGITQLFAIEHPNLVKKAVLVNSMACDGFHTLYNQGLERLEKMMQDKDYLSKAIKAIAPYCDDESLMNKVIDTASKASKQVFLEQPVTMHEVNWTDKMDNLTCPTLFMYGKKDVLVFEEETLRTVEKIPNCTYKVFEKCGHSPMLEWPEDFYNTIIEFIE